MTASDWITLVVAVLGVLHGPLFGKLLNSIRKSSGAK